MWKIRERFRSVDRKHGDHYIDDDFKFCLVCSCAFNEDVACVKCDFSEITIDNRRKREHFALGVVDDRISWRISNDVQEFAKVFIILKLVMCCCLKYLVELHQLLSIHFLGLIEGDEANLLGWWGCISEWSFHFC